ncbi:MAG: hypothetical protein ACRD16_05130 [Thermoanaerobaculia bacterium]
MKISNLRREGPARVAATVAWEDSERPALEVFFETRVEFGSELEPDPNALLLAAYFPAIRHKEKRILLEGPVSPRMRDGLKAVASLFRGWYGGERDEPRLDVALGFAPPTPRSPGRAASFLSGGIDSLFTLRKNRVEIPGDHPASIRDVLWLEGREFQGGENSPAALSHAERLSQVLNEVARDAGATLVPVRTNVRGLDPDIFFFGYEFQAACVAAAAHVLSRRFDVVSFSSGWEMGSLIPWGTHPLVDPNLGTEALTVRHDGAAYGRAEKLRALAGWKVAIQNLVVCNENPTAASLNCGRCYKCVETMTLLLSEDLLAGARQFPFSDVTPDLIDGLTLAPNLRSSLREYAGFWTAMIPSLEARGRGDLSQSIQAKLADASRLELWLEERDWKGRLKRLDRRFAGGLGTRALRAVRKKNAFRRPPR